MLRISTWRGNWIDVLIESQNYLNRVKEHILQLFLTPFFFSVTRLWCFSRAFRSVTHDLILLMISDIYHARWRSLTSMTSHEITWRKRSVASTVQNKNKQTAFFPFDFRIFDRSKFYSEFTRTSSRFSLKLSKAYFWRFVHFRVQQISIRPLTLTEQKKVVVDEKS